MFDIGWIEMAVIAMVALVVIGPKDLPRVMKTVGQWAQKARGLAREFQSGLNDMVREADLEEARDALKTASGSNLKKTIADTVDPTGSLKDEIRSLGESAQQAYAATDDGAATDDSAADGNADGRGDADSGGDAEPAGATIIKQPVQMAPAHSIHPPESDGPSLPRAAAGSEKD